MRRASRGCLGLLSNFGERGPGHRFVLLAGAELLLQLLVRLNHDLQRFGAAPPAELGSGDDPGVLIGEVVECRRRELVEVGDPIGELLSALRQRQLVERLGRRAGELESGRALLGLRVVPGLGDGVRRLVVIGGLGVGGLGLGRLGLGRLGLGGLGLGGLRLGRLRRSLVVGRGAIRALVGGSRRRPASLASTSFVPGYGERSSGRPFGS